MDTIGIDKIIEIYQAHYDKWDSGEVDVYSAGYSRFICDVVRKYLRENHPDVDDVMFLINFKSAWAWVFNQGNVIHGSEMESWNCDGRFEYLNRIFGSGKRGRMAYRLAVLNEAREVFPTFTVSLKV